MRKVGEGVVIIQVPMGNEIKTVIWRKSAYLRHVEKCNRRNEPIPKILFESPTSEEVKLKYMESL